MPFPPTLRYPEDYLHTPVVPIRGQTTVNGNVAGTTLRDAALIGALGIVGSMVVIHPDEPLLMEARPIATFNIANGDIGVAAPFNGGQVLLGTPYAITTAGAGAAPAPPLAPSIGLWMFGRCDPAMAASTTTLVMPNLAGFPNDIFNNEFWVQVIHNANAPGAAPEREIRRITDYVGATGTFTCDAFTVNVEANDLVAVFHESILPIEILGFGTLTTSSATTPRDNTRAEGDDYFNGCLLMTTEGTARFQPRRVVDYDGTGAPGTFTIDPNNPFTAATGLVDYVIIGGQTEFVPAADAVINRTPSDVIGNKADTIPAMNLAPGDDSLTRHIKAILERLGATPADPDDSALTNLGQRDDAATADTLADVTTTSIQAKLRRILLRMSPDAFTADIQGAARTELDTMLAQLATYFSAAGAAMALQVNGNLARTNLEQALSDYFAAFGCNGVNVFNPTIQGAPRTDLDTALNILATYLTAAGAAMSIQVNGQVARTNIEQAFEDFTAVFGADGANVFNPIIQGAARTDLDTALAQLATYFVAAGAAMALQVNNNVARTNLQQALNDYFTVVGCDGANIFNPTIQGAAQLTIEAAFAALATYISPAGAAYSATVNPGAAAKTNIEQTLEDLGDMLAGAPGIVTFPAAAVPGNGVSLAEVLRQIYNDVIAIAGAGVLHEQADVAVNITAIAAGETNVLNLAAANTRYVVRSLRLKCADPGANTVTVRLYELVNDVLTLVDSFDIAAANFATYHSITDMYGLFQLAGDRLQVTVQASGGGPYVVTGQYTLVTASV